MHHPFQAFGFLFHIQNKEKSHNPSLQFFLDRTLFLREKAGRLQLEIINLVFQE